MQRSTIDLDEREIATIQAALQLWLLRGGLLGAPVASGLVRSLEADVSTRGDAFAALSADEVEGLTNRLGTAAPAPVRA